MLRSLSPLLFWLIITAIIIKIDKLPDWMTVVAIVILVVLALQSPVTGPTLSRIWAAVATGTTG